MKIFTNTKGVTLPLFALCIPFIAILLGIIIDSGRIFIAKASLIHATDIACSAGISQLSASTTQLLNQLDTPEFSDIQRHTASQKENIENTIALFLEQNLDIPFIQENLSYGTNYHSINDPFEISIHISTNLPLFFAPLIGKESPFLMSNISACSITFSL